MSQVKDTSLFNGVILEISGKALIECSFNNQHQITIGIPQLDQAIKQVKFSQYEVTTGNLIKEIDLTAHQSIDIVEVFQQPTTERQNADDINIEAALSRNQSRLSDFYQAYKNEDSSIDWSKIDTKIYLPNTNGKFYDHDNQYTVAFKIEFSPQCIEGIEIRDDRGAIAKSSHSQQLLTILNIGNLCKQDSLNSLDVRVFCSPQTDFAVNYPASNSTSINDLGFVWLLCVDCGLIYANLKPQACFGNPNGHTAYSTYKFALPYSDLNTKKNTTGSGRRCQNCQAVYDPDTSYCMHCPSSTSDNHTLADLSKYSWAMLNEEPGNPGTPANDAFCMCGQCAGLYYPSDLNEPFSGIGNVCYDGRPHEKVGPYAYSLSYINS